MTRSRPPGGLLDTLYDPLKSRYWVAFAHRPPLEVSLVDKRLHARVPIDATLVCEHSGGASFPVQAKDISVGGMYLDSAEQPAFGTNVTMVGLLPGAKKELRLPAVVRWTKPGGFGVQFGLLGAVETHVISELMKIR